jgi:hypothetical protein
MANTNAPFGFSHVGNNSGATPSFGVSRRLISGSNTTKIFYGDAVVPVTGAATGYVTQATAGTVALASIFTGCEYYSTSQQKVINSRYWPGADATGDVTAFIVDDSNARFKVQADATGLAFAKVGQNLQLVVGTGNTATGVSGMYVSGTPATTATYPFILVELVTDPPGWNGTDATSGYNQVIVQFNNEIFRQLTGIA